MTKHELLAIVDHAYDRQSWHGTNLRGSIRGLTPEIAAWRPGRGRHNIWELVVHAAYWKYAVWRRLTGEKRGSFALEGSNWFLRPEKTTLKGRTTRAARTSRAVRATSATRAWKADVALLDEMHVALRNAIAALPASQLHAKPPGTKISNFGVIAGLAAHDLYHAGQIQLLKKLQRG
jgi:DinB superfamily